MNRTTNTAKLTGGDLAIAHEVAICTAEEDERAARRSAGVIRRRKGVLAA